VRRLQRDWRDTGPVPHADFETLGARYKDACDAVYGKREAAADAAREAREAEVREAGEALTAAESADGPDAARDAVLAARTAVMALGDRKELAELRSRLDACIVSAIDSHPEAFRDTELDPEVSRTRKVRICEKIEGLCAEAEQAAPALSDAEAMAAKLRAALADNALGGVLAKASPQAVTEMVAEARASWSRLGPVPRADGAELEARFAAACEKAVQLA